MVSVVFLSLVNPSLVFSQTCPQWHVPSHPALTDMHLCHEAPISRQLGSVCTEIRWLCSDQSIEQWLDQLFTHSHSDWFVHPHGKGLVLADWSNQDDSSWAVFWDPADRTQGKLGQDNRDDLAREPLRIMLSRFRPLIGANTDPKLANHPFTHSIDPSHSPNRLR